IVQPNGLPQRPPAPAPPLLIALSFNERGIGAFLPAIFDDSESELRVRSIATERRIPSILSITRNFLPKSPACCPQTACRKDCACVRPATWPRRNRFTGSFSRLDREIPTLCITSGSSRI